jgi:hypothetical protein
MQCPARQLEWRADQEGLRPHCASYPGAHTVGQMPASASGVRRYAVWHKPLLVGVTVGGGSDQRIYPADDVGAGLSERRIEGADVGVVAPS